MEELLKYAKALVLLQLEQMASGDEVKPTKPEILLARVGIPQKEIAQMLGKSADAVQKTISRAK